MRPDNFRIYSPLSFFEKADAEEGKQKRIGGIISTENLDKQGEVIVQKGLDFGYFEKNGWFNDNHSKDTDGVVGAPDQPVKRFQKGDILPDGSIAPSNCSWAEGYMFDTPRAKRIWETGHALTKANGNRRLGFSIEGSVLRRAGDMGKRVVQAMVRNVAITNCPVGEDTRLLAFAKSMQEAQGHVDEDAYWVHDADLEDGEDYYKALTMGAPSGPTPGDPPAGPRTGEGAGEVLAEESLEEDEKEVGEAAALSKSEAIEIIKSQFLGADDDFAERAYSTLVTLTERGLLGEPQ